MRSARQVRLVMAMVALTAGVALATFSMQPGRAETAKKETPMLAHMVFFTLKDRSPEAAKKLAAECQKYLTDHPGTVYFSAGIRGPEFDRDVNDKDFDVALHLVFEDKAAHDVYAVAPRHLEFIEGNKETWAKVRVFDSYLAQ